MRFGETVRVLASAGESIREYHQRHDNRIRSVLREVATATGKDTSSIQRSTIDDVGEMAIGGLKISVAP